MQRMQAQQKLKEQKQKANQQRLLQLQQQNQFQQQLQQNQRLEQLRQQQQQQQQLNDQLAQMQSNSESSPQQPSIQQSINSVPDVNSLFLNPPLPGTVSKSKLKPLLCIQVSGTVCRRSCPRSRPHYPTRRLTTYPPLPTHFQKSSSIITRIISRRLRNLCGLFDHQVLCVSPASIRPVHVYGLREILRPVSEPSSLPNSDELAVSRFA